MRGLFLTSVLAVLIVGARPAQATTIVDTGTSSGFIAWDLTADQWLGAEFSTTQTWKITSVEGWILSDSGGDVTFAIYTDGGDVPGTVLYSQAWNIPGPSPDAWRGPSGLSWLIPAGTYWVTFEVHPASTFAGGMRSPSTSPLINEAYRLPPEPWVGQDGLNLGVRINAVPELASSLSLLLFGTGFIGVARVALIRFGGHV